MKERTVLIFDKKDIIELIEKNIDGKVHDITSMFAEEDKILNVEFILKGKE